MMEKVSMRRAAGKAWWMIRGRSGIFAAYAVAMFAINALPFLIFGPTGLDERFPGGIWSELLVSFVGLTILGVSLMHFCVSSCRNRTSFFPKDRTFAVLRYFFASIAVSGIAWVFGVICGLPLFGILVSGMLESPDTVALAVALTFFAGVLVFLGVVVPCMRFSMIFPAISIGDPYSYVNAWKMTKGHSFRLIAPFMIVFAILVSFWAIWGLSLGEESFEQSMTFALLNVLLSTPLMLFLMTFYSILYEEFLARRRFMAATDDADEDTSSPSGGH